MYSGLMQKLNGFTSRFTILHHNYEEAKNNSMKYTKKQNYWATVVQRSGRHHAQGGSK
jgi:hypothetical protein